MLKRMLTASLLAGALLVAAPTAAFADNYHHNPGSRGGERHDGDRGHDRDGGHDRDRGHDRDDYYRNHGYDNDYYRYYGSGCDGYRNGYYYGPDGRTYSNYHRNPDCDYYYSRYGSYYGTPYCDTYDSQTGYCD